MEEAKKREKHARKEEKRKQEKREKLEKENDDKLLFFCLASIEDTWNIIFITILFIFLQ